MAKTTLAWRKERGVQSYNVQVFNNQGNVVFNTNTGRNTSVVVRLGYGRYTWQVQGVAAGGLTPFSQAMQFDVTTLFAPLNGASLRARKLVFQWQMIKRASYHLTVWKDRGQPTEAKVIDTDWAKTSYRPATLFAPGSYSWTVTVNGQAMPEWQFTVSP